MEVKATLKPGDKGTVRYVREYGDQLVQVRYRYDKQKLKRYTTVELIVDESDWHRDIRFAPDKMVEVRIGFAEVELREKAKQHGAWWNPDNRTWKMKFSIACELGLEKRIPDGLDF